MFDERRKRLPKNLLVKFRYLRLKRCMDRVRQNLNIPEPRSTSRVVHFLKNPMANKYRFGTRRRSGACQWGWLESGSLTVSANAWPRLRCHQIGVSESLNSFLVGEITSAHSVFVVILTKEYRVIFWVSQTLLFSQEADGEHVPVRHEWPRIWRQSRPHHNFWLEWMLHCFG